LNWVKNTDIQAKDRHVVKFKRTREEELEFHDEEEKYNDANFIDETLN